MAFSYQQPSTIVMDIGSHSCKINLSTSENYEPKIIQSVVGKVRKTATSCLNGDWHRDSTSYFGTDAQNKRGILKFEYPIIKGEIQNWDSMEDIWNYAFESELSINPADHHMLIAIPLNTSKKQQEKCEEIFLNTFQVSSVNFYSQPELARFQMMIQTGVIVDIGEGLTQITPFHDESIVKHAAINFNISGAEITDHLHRKLIENGNSLPKPCAELEIVREIKENCGCVRNDFKQIDGTKHELPDGQVLYLGNERHECAEILFDTYLCGKGLHLEIENAIMKCDGTIRKELFKNIYLIGGTSKLKGLRERLENELKALAPGLEVKVRTFSENQDLMTFYGGYFMARSKNKN